LRLFSMSHRRGDRGSSLGNYRCRAATVSQAQNCRKAGSSGNLALPQMAKQIETGGALCNI
jgi:hypothetical protein